jgi:hypothetical protein
MGFNSVPYGLNTATDLGKISKEAVVTSCRYDLDTCLTLRLPNYITSVIRVILVAGKVFTHNCATGKICALIQC